MNHALSLVRVKILRDEYLGEGKITDVTIRNVTSYLKVNIQDGAVWKQNKKSDIPIGGGYMLNDANPTVPEAILPRFIIRRTYPYPSKAGRKRI